MSTPQYHSVPQAAAILGVSKSTAWSLVWSGRLKAKRLGRRVLISDDTIREFVESCPDYDPSEEIDRG
ncbi:MAG: helix-turn-helix domain-containing protein [Fimbriimonadaceae bacterium]